METRDMPEIRFENDVPWKRNRFGELYRKSDERNNGQFGWNKTISIATMTWNETGNGAADSSLASYKVLRTGDIAFEGHTNKEFQFGRFVLNDIGDGITSSIFTILRPTTNQNIIFWKYLIHDEAVMRRKLVYSTKSGIMMNGLVVDDFMKQTIRFPSLPVQREIADLFSSLDRKLAAEQKKLAALKMAKHALFVKIFPREGETVPEIRFEGFSHPWEQRKLGSISEIKTGPFGSTLHADDYVTDGIPIITTEHFKNGDLPTSKNGLPQVSDEDYKRLSSYVLNEGDIVFSRVGSVDINALVMPSQRHWLFSGRVLRVRPDMVNDPQFLHTVLETETIKADIRSRAVGQTMPSINTEILNETLVMMPQLRAEQEQIGQFFYSLNKTITLHQRKCDKLRQAKSALLNQMFV